MRKIKMLNGRTVLIVEDAFLIALDIQRMLEVFGTGQTLFARNAAEAAKMRAHWDDIALAVIEIRSADIAASEMVNRLCANGTPVIGISAEVAGQHALTSGTTFPVVAKPVPEAAFVDAVRLALSGPS